MTVTADCNRSPPAARHSAADALPTRQGVVAPPKLFRQAVLRNTQTVAMAKSGDKRAAKTESRGKSDTSVIKVDKKAFDPTLASLFASSVCVSAVKCLYIHVSMALLTEWSGRPSASPSKVTLPGPRAVGE